MADDDRRGKHGPARTDPWVRFWSMVGAPSVTRCWPWIGAARRRGYGMFHEPGSQPGTRRLWVATRFLWERMYGPIPDGMQVLHHCDNPPCVRPTHLFLGTAADNHRDRMAKGRRCRPAAKPRTVDPKRRAAALLAGDRSITRAKITAEQAREIRDLSSRGVRNVDLAQRFGLGQSSISEIIRGRHWPNA